MNKIITIEGENTNYLISDDGRLFNKKTNKFLKGSINSTGYRVYQLTVNGKYYNFLCHRLVAEYFLPNQENYPVVHHIDGNKLNNKVENLKWVSFSDNLQESYLMGRRNTKNQSYITENELKNKEWRQIENSQYYVSEFGDVYNSNTSRKLKPKKDGYLRYTYYLDGKSITTPAHILVYKAFVSPIINYEIDHIDGDKFNNHYTNLRDISHSENMINAMSNGHKNAIAVIQLDEKQNFVNKFPSIKAAAKYMDCQPALISRALKNKNQARGCYWIRK